MTRVDGGGTGHLGRVVVGLAVVAVSVVGASAGQAALAGLPSVGDHFGHGFDGQLVGELVEGALWLVWRGLRRVGR